MQRKSQIFRHTKKRGTLVCPFHGLRPSHCPVLLNEQHEAHADMNILPPNGGCI